MRVRLALAFLTVAAVALAQADGLGSVTTNDNGGSQQRDTSWAACDAPAPASRRSNIEQGKHAHKAHHHKTSGKKHTGKFYSPEAGKKHRKKQKAHKGNDKEPEHNKWLDHPGNKRSEQNVHWKRGDDGPPKGGSKPPTPPKGGSQPPTPPKGGSQPPTHYIPPDPYENGQPGTLDEFPKGSGRDDDGIGPPPTHYIPPDSYENGQPGDLDRPPKGSGRDDDGAPAPPTHYIPPDSYENGQSGPLDRFGGSGDDVAAPDKQWIPSTEPGTGNAAFDPNADPKRRSSPPNDEGRPPHQGDPAYGDTPPWKWPGNDEGAGGLKSEDAVAADKRKKKKKQGHDKGSQQKGKPHKGKPDQGTPDKGTPDDGTPDKGTPDKGGADAGETSDDPVFYVAPGQGACDNTYTDDDYGVCLNGGWIGGAYQNHCGRKVLVEHNGTGNKEYATVVDACGTPNGTFGCNDLMATKALFLALSGNDENQLNAGRLNSTVTWWFLDDDKQTSGTPPKA